MANTKHIISPGIGFSPGSVKYIVTRGFGSSLFTPRIYLVSLRAQLTPGMSLEAQLTPARNLKANATPAENLEAQ